METLCKIRDLYRAIAEFETRFEKAHHLCLNEGMLLCCLSRKKRLSSGEIAEQHSFVQTKVVRLFKPCFKFCNSAIEISYFT